MNRSQQLSSPSLLGEALWGFTPCPKMSDSCEGRVEGRGKERSRRGQVMLPKPQLLCLGARLEGMTGAQTPSLLEEAD